jgi:hypothetical protein
MKNGRYSEEQIMTVLKQMEAVRMGVRCQNSKRVENGLVRDCR